MAERKTQKTRLGVMLGLYADAYMISGSQIAREAGVESNNVGSIMRGTRGASGVDGMKLHLWMIGYHEDRSDMLRSPAETAAPTSTRQLPKAYRRRHTAEERKYLRELALKQHRVGGKFASKKGEGTKGDAGHDSMVVS